jgi:transposase InsO family protein
MYGPDPVPAIAAVELVLPQAQRLLGPAPLIEYQPDPYTGEIVPIMLVTDNGGPFQSFRFSALITSRPELRHVRTRVRSLGQNDVRACLRLTQVRAALPRAGDDPLDLVREAEAFRVELNTVRPHEALARTLSRRRPCPLGRPGDPHL